MSDEELEKKINERANQLEVKKSTSLEMPNYIPKVDTNKELEDQASDVVKIMGAQIASQDEKFMGKVADNFQSGVLTEQETKNMQRQRLQEEEFYLKWQDLLNFIFIKQSHGLGFMKIMVWVAMLPYIATRLLGMVVKGIGLIGDFVNEIFNSVFGGKGKYLRNASGEVIIDPKTKKPYVESQGYNLLAKLLFGVVVAGAILALVFLLIQLFTGVDIFNMLRSLL